MSISGIRSAVQTIIQRAGAATGVDPGYLMKTAQRESSFNPTARASTSSATGLFQFTEQTWLATVKQFGDRHGYSAYAAQIRQNSEGRYVVSGGSRQAVLDLRMDPTAASVMAGEFTQQNAAYLKGRIGREPTQGELYMAHFMGPAGSARLIDALESQPMAPAANIFPDAARANPTIFYRGGRAATVQEVYANLVRTGAVPPPLPAPEPVGFIQFAGNSRSQEVKREQEVLMALILGGGRGDENSTPGSRLGGSLFSTEMLRVLADASSGRDSATARRGEDPLLG
ncbi:MAG: transglycosylase SLT domain-containing protein [Phenylobacterium sp.]|uniref:transglycosylase SLT domain-containing protein n=1 Tax=Phenylobacterium sp. TaxID=1871053 RepID=UPI0025E835E6|nr:transglycosylase SLT domain-containing protein [Phenylobacterium sp.]MCA6299458.1 transglycosylase SLT domain-containing protein [Phenylobacterium sp.]